MKVFFFGIIIFVVACLVLLWIDNKRVPKRIGVKNGQFARCPMRPNCVSSQCDRPSQYIDPIRVGDIDNPLGRVKAIALSIAKSKIITETDDYLHVEFRSRIFSFVDDAEFFLDRKKGVIHMRSAARVGYSDMGVNRKRLELIKREFTSV